MYIKQIRIGKFRHIENVELGPFLEPGKNSAPIALAGPNGGGKSSILELIGYSLSSSLSLSWQLSRTFPDHSFEVTFGINDTDVEIIESWITDTAPNEIDLAAARELIGAREVYRGFNMEGGPSADDSAKQNRMFRVATLALKDHYQRSVGLFLRADRTYPNKNFDQQKLLQWDKLKRPQHRYSIAFNSSELQYQDMYDHLVQRRYHYLRELGVYHDRKSKRRLKKGERRPPDPLRQYNTLLKRLFPGYRFESGDSEIPGDLFVSISRSLTLPFRDLSSGEKEVFFILASLLRHDVENAILVIDEPELHLHPEFGRLLVRELMTTKPGNQVWLATHNPEVIDEVGAESTLYVSRNPSTRKALVSSAADEPEAARMLRDLFGFSGYVGIGKSLVFLEGIDSSADRKLVSRLLPPGGGSVKIVPAGGVSDLHRINAAVLSILEAGLNHLIFYVIRDRDYLSDEAIDKHNSHISGRIRVLTRHQIENYLLIPDAIQRVLHDVYDRVLDADAIQIELERSADSISGEVAAGLLREQIASVWTPEEIVPAGMLKGESVADQSTSATNARSTLATVTWSRLSPKLDNLNTRLAESEVTAAADRASDQAAAWLSDESWRNRYPGKRILQVFASRLNLGNYVIFQNLLIKEVSLDRSQVDEELLGLLDQVTKGADSLV